MVDFPKHERDPLFTQAEAKIAQTLGLKASDVTISLESLDKDPDDRRIVLRETGGSDTAPNERKPVQLYVNVHKTGSDVAPVESRQHIRTGLSRIGAIASAVQMTPIEVEMKAALAALNKVIEGTSFDRSLLENDNLNPEVAQHGKTHNHVIEDLKVDAYGARFSIVTERKKGQGRSQEINDIAEYLNKDGGAAFKAKSGARVAKYVAENFVAAKMEERKLASTQENFTKIAEEFKTDLDALKAKTIENVSKLILKTNTNPDTGMLEVTLGTQAQYDAMAKDQNWRWQEPANADDLKKDNAYSAIGNKVIEATETTPRKEPQVARALGRALQDMPHYKKLAGIVDMRNLIGKEFARIYNDELKGKPEKQELLKKIANSPMFKEHHHGSSWHVEAQQVGDAPSDPQFRRISGANDMTEVKLILTQVPGQEEPVKALLKGIISGPVVDHQTAPVASAPAATPAPVAAAPAAPAHKAPEAPAAAPAAAHIPAIEQAVQTTQQAAEQPVMEIGGTKIRPKDLQSFVQKMGSHTERAEASKAAAANGQSL